MPSLWDFRSSRVASSTRPGGPMRSPALRGPGGSFTGLRLGNGLVHAATAPAGCGLGRHGPFPGDSRAPGGPGVAAPRAPLLAMREPPTKLDMARTPEQPLPEEVLNRGKTGFSIPVPQWLEEAEDHSDLSRQRGLRGWARLVYRHHTGGPA
jgi:hypothetical protein